MMSLAQGPEKTAWDGQWIWLDSDEQARNAYGHFRRTFHAQTAATLQLAITADSFYELYLDGARLGRGPSRSHLNWYSFDRYEVPLSAGDHVLAVLIHHIGVENATIMTGRPGLLADVALGENRFGSDDQWRCHPGTAWRSELPCLMSHYGFWEECDLRRLPAGWTQPDFDDACWQPARIVGQPPCPPWPRLIEADLPPPCRSEVGVRRLTAGGVWTQGPVAEDSDSKRQSVAGGWLPHADTREIPSKQAASRNRLTRPGIALPWHIPADKAAGGHWLTLDFGRTVSGYPEVQVETAAEATTIDLSYDDVADAGGVVNPERSYARLTDRFCLGPGRTTLRPRQPRGFRYLMIDVSGQAPVRLTSVRAMEETYPFAPPAHFASADPRLDSYIRTAAETVRICATDAFTDCANRERVQWMEDIYLQAKVAAYAFGDTKLLRRALFQGAQNALPDGRINGFMPSERTGCAFASSSLVWLHLLVDYWLHAGAEDDLHRLLPTAEKLLGLIKAHSDADGLLTWPGGQFWDWSPIEGQGCLLLTNAACIWALKRLAGQAIFRQALGARLAEQAATASAAAHERFWDADRQLYRDLPLASGRPPIFSQHANTLAVLAGICPQPNALLRRLIDPANLGPIPVGEHSLAPDQPPAADRIVPVGTLWFGHFLCEALFEHGLAEDALAHLHLLWEPFIAEPTFPETRIANGNTTHCHGWAAGPAYLLPAYLLGARPSGPGWSRVDLKPLTGLLPFASGTIATPLGTLRIAWEHTSNGQPTLTLDIPPGMDVQHQG